MKTLYTFAAAMIVGTAALSAQTSVDCSFMPEAGSTVANLQSIEITFASSDDVQYSGNDNSAITLTNLNSTAVYVVENAMELDRSKADGTSYLLSFIAEGSNQVGPVNETGYYKLVIPEGAFTYSSTGENVGAVTAQYTIGTPSAVAEIIESKPVMKGTYNLIGKRMADGAKLPAGIYIVDGRKTIIR